MMSCCGGSIVEYLNKEEAKNAISSIVHGMQINPSPDDWPEIREILVTQMSAWQESGHIELSLMTNKEIHRIDSGIPMSATHTIPAS